MRYQIFLEDKHINKTPKKRFFKRVLTTKLNFMVNFNKIEILPAKQVTRDIKMRGKLSVSGCKWLRKGGVCLCLVFFNSKGSFSSYIEGRSQSWWRERTVRVICSSGTSRCWGVSG